MWSFGVDAAEAWLVLQHDGLADAPTVIAAAVTTRVQRAGEPLNVVIEPSESQMARRAWVKVTQIHTLARHRARDRIGALNGPALERVARALTEVLGVAVPRGLARASGRSGQRDSGRSRS